MFIRLVTATSDGHVSGIEVFRDPDEKKIYSISTFFHLLKKVLNKAYNLDLVKRNMEQDNHMMGDKHTFYLRDRKWRFAIYDPNYMLRPAYERFNNPEIDINGAERGVWLQVEHWDKNQWSGDMKFAKINIIPYE